ncbi:MAG: hypothetical protein WBM90_12720 [Acidimicrobiia bacterium]
MRVRGWAVSLGGVAWLAGILILELAYDSSQDDLPTSFPILALVAGLAIGWGCWTSASNLESRIGRIGLRSVGGCSLVLGVGFGLDLIPDMFLAFLLTYTVGLFLLPVAFLVFGIGVTGSTVYPGWAKWLPYAIFATAVIPYGFHALARDVWDPSDAVWFGALGLGWVILGIAITSIRNPEIPQEAEDRPLAPAR